MQARTYKVTITGETPLLLHYDNLAWADVLKEWQKDPAHQKGSVAGDDRSPAHRWVGCLYHESGRLVIPADNLMTVLREGGKRCPTGKRGGTYKAQSQSGLVVDQSAWPLTIDGRTEIPFAPFLALTEEADFDKHVKVCERHGFTLFVKRAKVNQTKHVRVRPRFDRWQCSGTVTVFDEMITEGVLANFLTLAGAYAGIGDWRPSSPKSPGPFGKFTSTVEAVS